MHAFSRRIPVFKSLLVLCVLAGATLLGQELTRRANTGRVVVPQATVEWWPQVQPVYQAQAFPEQPNSPVIEQFRVPDQPQPMDLAQQSKNSNSNARQPVVAEKNWGSSISQQAIPYAIAPNSWQPSPPGTASYPQQPTPPGIPSYPNPYRSVWSAQQQTGITHPGNPIPANIDESLPPDAQLLLQELRAQNPETRDEKKLAALRGAIEKKFQAKHDVQVKRLAMLLAEVEQAQQILDRREKQRDEIIDRRVAELLGQSDPLGWNFYVDASRTSVPMTLTQSHAPHQNPTRTPGIQSEVRTYSIPDSNRGAQIPLARTLPAPLTLPSPVPAPPQASQLATLDSPATAAIEPTATSTTGPSNGLIAIGYRWKGLKEQFELAEVKYRQGLLGQSEFVKFKNDLAAIEAQWQQQHRELEREVKIKHLALEDAKLEVETAENNIQYELERNMRLRSQGEVMSNIESFHAKVKLARNAVHRAELELQSASEQLAWANEFAKELESKPKDSSTDEKREPSDESIPPAIESSALPIAPVATEPVEKSEPTEPTAPATPKAPATPTAPLAPTAPTDPTTKPAETSEQP